MLQRLLLQAQTAVASYADPEWAAERGWPLLVDALRFRLDTALPGSDAQLAVVNSLAGCPLPQSVLTSFQGWLLDVAVPPGLVVDTDLRWRILQALVANGGGHRGRDRRRGAARPHLHRAAAGRAGPRPDPDGRGQGAGVAARRPRRRPAQRRAGGDHRRVLAPRAATAPAAVRGALLRRGRRGVGAAHERAGPVGGRRAVPVLGGGEAHGRRRPTAGSPRRATRPRCAGWCRRAGPGSCGRWPRGSSTAHSARDRYLGPR